MKFLKQDMIDIIHDDHDSSRFEIVDYGDWFCDYKVEIKSIVFKYEGKFYEITCSRSGSHYTDWYYEYEDWSSEVEAYEVEPVEVVRTEWRVKK